MRTKDTKVTGLLKPAIVKEPKSVVVDVQVVIDRLFAPPSPDDWKESLDHDEADSEKSIDFKPEHSSER